MGAMVSSSHFKLAGILTFCAGMGLSACAGFQPVDLTSLPDGEVEDAEETAIIETMDLDPVVALQSEDPLYVTASDAPPSSEVGSRRVPLGTLTSPTSSSVSSQALETIESIENSGMPLTTDEPSADLSMGAAARVLPAQQRITPEGQMFQDSEPYSDESIVADDLDETVIISSESSIPQLTAREFIPANVMPPVLKDVASGLGQIPLTAAEKNVIRRFEALRRLQNQDLITQQEFARRRAANIGALLPYTRDPASIGLGRSVPGTDAIVARLAALKRAFEIRAITSQQHALERTMILDALLPEVPNQRDDPKPPPADVLVGAAMVGQLENLRERGLISASELKAEQDTIEYMLRTGTFPLKADVNIQATEANQPKAAPALIDVQKDSVNTQITGPVLHIASFRSQASALRVWETVVAANPETLDTLQPIVRRVDLGPDQGIFYRLMAGTFDSIGDAEETCIKLKKNNQFCRPSADGL